MPRYLANWLMTVTRLWSICSDTRGAITLRCTCLAADSRRFSMLSALRSGSMLSADHGLSRSSFRPDLVHLIRHGISSTANKKDQPEMVDSDFSTASSDSIIHRIASAYATAYAGKRRVWADSASAPGGGWEKNRRSRTCAPCNAKSKSSVYSGTHMK